MVSKITPKTKLTTRKTVPQHAANEVHEQTIAGELAAGSTLQARPGPKPGVAPEVSAFYSPDSYTADSSIGYMIRRISSLLSQDLDREFQPCGLTNAQWHPLHKIYWGHASTVAEVARGCELDAGSMTRLLDRLESKQLLRRIRSSDDRRVVNLELTDAGRDVARGIPEVLCRTQNEYLAGFTHVEWQALASLLSRILDTAQTRAVAAGRTHSFFIDLGASKK